MARSPWPRHSVTLGEGSCLLVHQLCKAWGRAGDTIQGVVAQSFCQPHYQMLTGRVSDWVESLWTPRKLYFNFSWALLCFASGFQTYPLSLWSTVEPGSHLHLALLGFLPHMLKGCGR